MLAIRVFDRPEHRTWSKSTGGSALSASMPLSPFCVPDARSSASSG
jgi:hypothetical protein